MMQKCLAAQIGKNAQVYIDDVVITTKDGATLIEDLKETFDNLDKFCLKLNPTKCSFGVPAGELLGFLVSARGIEANPDKIQAIVTMRKPTKLKEIQQLTGRVAALSRFVARLGEKALLFYALIKQGEKFEWTEEADRAFEDLKRTISTPPILVAPKEKEPLLLYIAAMPQVFSTVLVVEREEEGKLHGVQRPVYFISEVLSSSKQRLSNDEADVLANIGSQCLAIPPGVFWEEITERSTKAKKQQKRKEKDDKASGAPATAKANISEEEEESHRCQGADLDGTFKIVTFVASNAMDESGDEEISPPRFISTMASEKLAKIFSDMSFESSADSDISDDSSNIDSFTFIDKSTIVGEVFANLYDGVTKPDKVQHPKYHQIYAIGEPSREQETSENFDDAGNPKATRDPTFNTTKNSKKVQIHPIDPKKTTSIATDMDLA
ncbi:hypothetical protein QYE76_037968 [Lolium multiflorum]|uniref:Reverse transcriptase/retrotransposon-derived protein RNase H-like domain-containing protein n=1 Tax=Lolium multiflorum TaxID=4521 RepID=A0AAD8T6K1_LOLMU|nr:hypothetical protein QYE76_037968 [Lolium multiflorum]